MAEEFEVQMESTWQHLTAQAARSRDPNLATFDFYDWYRSLSPERQRRADEQLAKWVHSSDDKKRFDALALIGEFRIASARPSLEDLLRRLPAGEDEPQTRFLRSKIMRLIDALGRP
jgi:hypothetical protein